MALGGILGKGIRVGYASGTSPTTWTPIDQILQFTPASIKSDKLDITTHDTEGLLKRYMSGLRDVGDIEMELLADHDPSTSPSHNALQGFNSTGEIIWLRAEFPQSPDLGTTLWRVYELEVDVAEFTPMTPIADAQKTRVTFRFRGTTFNIYTDQPSAF